MLDPSLENIVAHQRQKKELIEVQKKDSLPHAILFTGKKGLGKRTLALNFASRILLDSVGNKEKNLKLLSLGNHPDLHFVGKEAGKKDISVESIRTLSNKLRLKPHSSNRSVAIIDNAELMSLTAANSLLMTLEEPPAHAVIFLITSSPEKLLRTIVSRCQSLQFAGLKTQELKKIINLISPGITGKNLELLTNHSEDSLEALFLDPFINPRISTVSDQKGLDSHLQQIVNSSKQIRKNLSKLTENSSPLPELAVSIASNIATEKESLDYSYSVIRKFIREEMLKADKRNLTRLAEILEECILSEKLVKERSLNPQLGLSSLLNKLDKISGQ